MFLQIIGADLNHFLFFQFTKMVQQEYQKRFETFFVQENYFHPFLSESILRNNHGTRIDAGDDVWNEFLLTRTALSIKLTVFCVGGSFNFDPKHAVFLPSCCKIPIFPKRRNPTDEQQLETDLTLCPSAVQLLFLSRATLQMVPTFWKTEQTTCVRSECFCSN